MESNQDCFARYIQILQEELRPAMGCTEPIAIAYAADKARDVLGCLPDRMLVEVSGNIIKNVKSVIIPHTGGLRGIAAAAAVGAVAGDAAAELAVISQVTPKEVAETAQYLQKTPIDVHCAENGHFLTLPSRRGKGRTMPMCALPTTTQTLSAYIATGRPCWKKPPKRRRTA